MALYLVTHVDTCLITTKTHVLNKKKINSFQVDICESGTHYWSEWYNTDTPDGNGDLELIELKGIGCAEPIAFQVVTADDQAIPYDQTGQVTDLRDCLGFMCLNTLNKQPCLDYKIRKCCPIEASK